MTFNLRVLSDTFAICRLDPNAAIRAWANGDFVSITLTQEELSIVCRQQNVPDDVHSINKGDFGVYDTANNRSSKITVLFPRTDDIQPVSQERTYNQPNRS